MCDRCCNDATINFFPINEIKFQAELICSMFSTLMSDNLSEYCYDDKSCSEIGPNSGCSGLETIDVGPVAQAVEPVAGADPLSIRTAVVRTILTRTEK